MRNVGVKLVRSILFGEANDVAFKSVDPGTLVPERAPGHVTPQNNVSRFCSRGREPTKSRTTTSRAVRKENTEDETRWMISELEKGPQPQLPRSSEELEDLHKLLHFPEEVALRLTESEYQLFYQASPQDYLRHVAQSQTLQKSPARPPPSPSRSGSNSSTTNSSTQTEDQSSWPSATAFSNVQILINRFAEVRWPPRDAFHARVSCRLFPSFSKVH